MQDREAQAAGQITFCYKHVLGWNWVMTILGTDDLPICPARVKKSPGIMCYSINTRESRAVILPYMP